MHLLYLTANLDLEEDPQLTMLDEIPAMLNEDASTTGMGFSLETTTDETLWSRVATKLSSLPDSCFKGLVVNIISLLVMPQNITPLLALPCFRQLEELVIEAPLSYDQLLQLQPALTPHLARLSLDSVGLNATQARALIQQLAPLMTPRLELDFNPINVRTAKKEFELFCQVILDSTLQTLQFCPANDESAIVLCNYLATISRPFHLIVTVPSGLSEKGFDALPLSLH